MSDFEIFWLAYPKKTGKKPCKSWWERHKITPEESRKIIEGVEAHKRYAKKWQEGFIPNPLTFLNQERWNDEFEPASSSPLKRTQTPSKSTYELLGYLDRTHYEKHHTEQILKDMELRPEYWVNLIKTHCMDYMNKMPEETREKMRNAVQKGLDNKE